MKKIYKIKDLAFDITLYRDSKRRDTFTVQYGRQVSPGLSYEEAARTFGLSLLHALAIDGKLD